MSGTHHSGAAHGQTEHADHAEHGGHGDHVAQFRRLFWLMLVLSLPVQIGRAHV